MMSRFPSPRLLGFVLLEPLRFIPLVPLYLTFIAGTTIEEVATRREARARRDISSRLLLFIFGFSTVFVGLARQPRLSVRCCTNIFPVFRCFAGIAIIVMGLHFLGVFRFAFLYREARVDVQKPVGIWAPTSWGWPSVSVGRLASDQFWRPFSRLPPRRRQSARDFAARRLFGRAWPAVFAGGAGH